MKAKSIHSVAALLGVALIVHAGPGPEPEFQTRKDGETKNAKVAHDSISQVTARS